MHFSDLHQVYKLSKEMLVSFLEQLQTFHKVVLELLYGERSVVPFWKREEFG